MTMHATWTCHGWVWEESGPHPRDVYQPVVGTMVGADGTTHFVYDADVEQMSEARYAEFMLRSHPEWGLVTDDDGNEHWELRREEDDRDLDDWPWDDEEGEDGE